MSYLCPHCNSFPLEDFVWWVSGRIHTNWLCAICGEKYDWKQPNRLLVVRIGGSIEQAKVFEAHAVPQGLCANLVKSLKLLANQQEDGDGLLQNIVKDLDKESRKVLRTACVNSSKLTMSAPLMLDPQAEARKHFKYESRKCQKGARR